MSRLAWRSLRHRPVAFAATFLAVLLGTALIGSFATLVETATGPVSDADAEALVTMGAVVGGWGAMIVLFSVASTAGVVVRQRAGEIGLLRTVGATPRQARRLVRSEVLLVSVSAAIAGAAVASVGGRALLAMIRSGGLVSDDVTYGGGMVSLASAAALVVVTARVAAGVAARRAVRGPARLVAAEADAGALGSRLPWWRRILGTVLVGYGVAMGVVTITVTAHADDPYAAMQTSGSAAILVSVGMAVLAPALLRLAATALRPLVDRRSVGHLAAVTTTQRSALLAGVLGPVIVLTSAAIGTLMLVGIDGRSLDVAALDAELQDVADTVTLLNNVVVGMIVLFAAIMVVNSFAAVVAQRREEIRRLRLVGATPGQVRGSVLVEAAVVALVGVVLGAVASLATVVPFAVARDEGIVPDGQLWLPPVVALGAFALTMLAGRAAVRGPALTQPVR